MPTARGSPPWGCADVPTVPTDPQRLLVAASNARFFCRQRRSVFRAVLCGDRGAGGAHGLEGVDVVGAVVAAAVDDEGGRAGDGAEVGAVDVLYDPRGAGMLLEILCEAGRGRA